MSTNSNRKKANQLGMPYGTARGQLIKQLLFGFVVKTKENNCYQCNEPILNATDMSIEHKQPWLDSDSPIDLFFDKDNIAYSHLSCNCAAARKDTTGVSNYNSQRKGITNGRARKIQCTNLDTGEIVFVTGGFEIKQLGFEDAHVYAVCNGQRTQHKGYSFKYV